METFQVPFSGPSLQSQVRYAEYQVKVQTDTSITEAQKAIRSLLEAAEFPWHHLRDTGPRHYDLRSLIMHIWLVHYESPLLTVGMRLRCDPTGTGRPEQVAAALGLTEDPESINRTKLILAE